MASLGNRTAANQPPPLVGHNVVTADVALVEALRATRGGRRLLRLGSSYDGTYGALSTSAADLRTIVARTTPTL